MWRHHPKQPVFCRFLAKFFSKIGNLRQNIPFSENYVVRKNKNQRFWPAEGTSQPVIISKKCKNPSYTFKQEKELSTGPSLIFDLFPRPTGLGTPTEAKTDAKSVSFSAEPNKTKSPLEINTGCASEPISWVFFWAALIGFSRFFGSQKAELNFYHPVTSSIYLSSSTESSRHRKQTTSIPGGPGQVPLRKKKRKGALARQILFAALWERDCVLLHSDPRRIVEEEKVNTKLLFAILSCEEFPDQNFTEACKRD
jgi:hypothetical protein